MDAGLKLRLEGRRAIVTGGSRGVGRATAMLLAEAGADVVIGYRSRSAEASRVVEELKGRGVLASGVAGDLARPEDVRGLFDEATAMMGGVDIVVVNAGVWPPDDVPIARMSMDQWSGTVGANLTSAFLTVREAARAIQGAGRIVLVSSTAGQRGEANHADYAATKGGMISLTKSVAVELAPRGITVNCVAPGWIDTEMVALALDSAGRSAIEAAIPVGRVASPDDVAGPILFLCSTLARHVTGEILNVNGGSVMVG
jgi:3-oxoacyl-[acyl-carrier protein] reductase